MKNQAQQLSEVTQRLRQLPATLLARSGFAEIVGQLKSKGRAGFDGVWGSSRALITAAIANESPGVVVVVCSRQADLDLWSDDLGLFSEIGVDLFAASDSEPGEEVVHDEIHGQRLRMLKRWAQHSASDRRFIVTSIQSLLQPVPSREALAENTRLLQVGQQLNQQDFLTWLVEHDFHNTSAVELPGEFTSRGGIVDIFASDWEDPVRIEFFGDEIESIRRFAVAGQRSLEVLDEIDITILKATRADRSHFADYLPDDSWVLLVEPNDIEEQGKHYLERIEHPEDFHSTAAVYKRLDQFGTATLATVATSQQEVECRLSIESVESYRGDVARVCEQLDATTAGHEVMVVCPTEAETRRLGEMFAEIELTKQGRLHLVVGHLHAGFRLLDQRLVLIGSDELFHRTVVSRPSRRRLSRTIDSFLDLKSGDLVVHIAHGIGRYRGLKMLDKDQRAEEHLEIEFAGGTRLYVPALKINLVQKYVGGSKSRPALAKIGGQTWSRQKEAAEKAVADLAVEMLDVQAARQSRPGIAFAPDSTWQQEFDASFPYQETPDQLTAIESIKGDMQRARPMDRLLCGDVGFGKTEVAIRAAFKAVENGYQVAILAPTTILVEQHYRTFRERMAEFPFEIARLSRFCTHKQQTAIVRQLAEGKIDIVIGTHRLASKDVLFQNLGLVMIDEEQRFGVAVKERLKQLRQTVDVLTMTATPIPRTLHLSLLGLRDISNLETPPQERIAVETRVSRWDESMVRHAILRELNRTGQIYFVHNRVMDIEKVAHRLRQLVPEATYDIGHGQMPEGKLEQVMCDFVDHKFDVLVATTIVESGLDIPNANTIFIDEADRYGLSDLHQLRGRVGRFKHRAYCYLMIDEGKHLTPTSARRLKAIEEFSKLGAGFAIAMRDLELRGAGNILGTQQSGHISAVGYELYCQLLDQTVRRIKMLPPAGPADVNVDLPIRGFISSDYVGDMRLKIDLYRRLGRIATAEQLADFRSELDDRFGSRPAEVDQLLELAALKIAAGRWKIDSVHLEDSYVVLGYKHPQLIKQLAKQSGGQLRVVDRRSAYLPLGKQVTDAAAIFKTVKSLLQSE